MLEFVQERFNFAKESMPDESECYRPDKKKLKVFMDLHANMLTDDESFELVSSEDEADVVYTKEKISDFRFVFFCQHHFLERIKCW